MANQFKYKAKNSSGDVIKGSIEAENKSVIARQLRDKGYYITEINQVRESIDIGEVLKLHKKVKLKDLSLFSQQFAAMIDAGISLVDALNILADQSDHKHLKKVLMQVRDDVETGVSLADAVSKHPETFPELYSQLIRAGESGGVLDTILNKLANHYDRQHELNSMVKSALYYPAVILSVGLIVVIFLVTQVVPQFVGMFQDFGTALPLPTRMLLAVSAFAQSYWWAVILAVLALIFLFSRYRKTPQGKAVTDSWILKVPVIGPMMRKVYISRFSSTLAILIDSGVDLLTSLNIVEDVVGNKVYSDIITDARIEVREGSSLSVPLEKSGEYPPMVVHMLKVGEETGAIGSMLNKVSRFYDRQVEANVEAAISLIEPLMIVALAVMVGFVAVSIVTPMFDMFQHF
ncbi:type II secretion system F family protein [Halanaerobium sp. Z-7514]|uniref:Type II secretion system F family protein n=1 Tax=Halanaerobium polyolivorans TaxID=2886943 RepID=A0AAW4WRS9_9FIRM|nr:type II secretion system F family protein [Halanaerobium polyolivorans]MCC3143721.1 type II secretion system F family protein [Halanaerobium polyolivorans]